jgi:biotin carboxyl carrier protein
MKYVATIGGQEYTVSIERSGEVAVCGTPRTVHLENIDGDSLFSLLIGTTSYEVFVERHKDKYHVTVEGNRYEVLVEDERLRRLGRRGGAGREETGAATVTSPMPGVVVTVPVQAGQTIKAGDSVAVLEAMKMENEIQAPRDGVVESVHVTPGQRVDLDDVIARIGAPES